MDWASKLDALDVVTMMTLLDVTSLVPVISSTDPSVRCLFRDLVVLVVTVELSISSLVGAEDEMRESSRLDSDHFLFDKSAGSWVDGGISLRCLRARSECFCSFFCGESDDRAPDVEDGSSVCPSDGWD